MKSSLSASVAGLAIGLCCLLVTGCEREKRAETVDVFAASSLTESFRELESSFEAANPKVDVRLTFAGSQVLRMQIAQGAKADVFASANRAHIDALADAGFVDSPRGLAANDLCVIEPADATDPMEAFDDLRDADKIVVGDESVPVGRYTERLLQRAESVLGRDFVREVRSKIVSREANVRLVRAKVELGVADAAIVYCTDAIASDRVRTVRVPESVSVSATYLIATTKPRPAAEAFVEFASSADGRAVLTRHGFGTPR